MAKRYGGLKDRLSLADSMGLRAAETMGLSNSLLRTLSEKNSWTALKTKVVGLDVGIADSVKAARAFVPQRSLAAEAMTALTAVGLDKAMRATTAVGLDKAMRAMTFSRAFNPSRFGIDDSALRIRNEIATLRQSMLPRLASIPPNLALSAALQRAVTSNVGIAAAASGALVPRHMQPAREALEMLARLQAAEAEQQATPDELSPFVSTIGALASIDGSGMPFSDCVVQITDALEAFAQRLEALTPRKSRFNWNTIIAFIALLVAVYTAVRQDQQAIREQVEGAAEAERSHRLQEVLERLARIQEQAIQAKETNDFPEYVVVRTIDLRLSKDRRSTHLCTLFPGDVVRVVSRRGRQVRIERDDNLAGTVQTGWVPKKYLKRL